MPSSCLCFCKASARLKRLWPSRGWAVSMAWRVTNRALALSIVSCSIWGTPCESFNKQSFRTSVGARRAPDAMQTTAFASCPAVAQEEDWTANLSEDSWPLLADNDNYSCNNAERPTKIQRRALTNLPWSAVHEVVSFRISGLSEDERFLVCDVWVPDEMIVQIYIPTTLDLHCMVARVGVNQQATFSMTGNHRTILEKEGRDRILLLTVESSIFMRHEFRPFSQVDFPGFTIFSPFCGGIGGWAHAARFMAQHGYPLTCPLALDVSFDAAFSYAETHGMKLVEYRLTAENLKEPCVMVANVQQDYPWMGASIMGTNVVTISWPCVTFSNAGGQKGWSPTTMEIFRTTVKQAERIGASFLLLENVPPVWTDWSWRATLLGELANGHFRMIFAEILNAKTIVPADRSRFIGVAVHETMLFAWDKDKKHNLLRSFWGTCRNLDEDGAWFESIPQPLARQASLNDEDLDIYTCTRRSAKSACSSEAVLQQRLVTKESPLPATTMMRSYSRQHLFREVQHGYAKILGNLRRDEFQRPRFFTHPEICLAMGFTNPINLPVSLHSGCSQTGNAIMQIHAMAACWVMIASQDLQCAGDFQDFQSCVSTFQACRLTTSGDLLFREGRCLIGFREEEAPRPVSFHECVIRIQYKDVRQIVHKKPNQSIAKILHQRAIAMHDSATVTFRGIQVDLDFIPPGGGIICIQDTSADESITPTIPFEVDQTSPLPGEPPRQNFWNSINTQPGAQILCRIWNSSSLAAEFLIPHDYAPGISTDRGVLNLQPAVEQEQQIQIFITGGGGATRALRTYGTTPLRQALSGLFREDLSEYKILAGARILDISRTIFQLQLRNHDTVTVMARHPGGGKQAHVQKDEKEAKPPKQKKPAKTFFQLSLENLTIAPGSFLLSDDSAATVGGTFHMSGKGVFTIPPSDFPTILQGKHPLVTQELGLLVLTKPSDTTMPFEAVEFAATDTGGSGLLVQAFLLQFGANKIKQGQVKNLKIPVEQSITISATAYRDEWDDTQADWENLVRGPAKHVIETLQLGINVYEVWGRSWRSHNKPAHPDKAESFRIWIKVNEKIAKDLFRKSGFTFPPYYVEIKNEESQLARWAFRILWIPKDMETADAISKTPGHQGLIRGRTGRGIRLQDADFQKAFAEMYPGRTIPLQIEAKFFWLLLGAPSSATMDTIAAFLEGAQIKGKPLRKLGANWKVCTEEKLKETQFAINGKNMLFQPLPDRKATPNPILAFGANKGAGKGKGKDILQQHDPWAKSLAQSPAQDMHFQQQQKQISAVQSEVNELKSTMRQLQTRSEATEQKTDKIQQDLQDVKESFTKTLDKAMRDQTNHLMQSMEALLRGRPSGGLGTDGSNANKRAKIPQDDTSMD